MKTEDPQAHICNIAMQCKCVAEERSIQLDERELVLVALYVILSAYPNPSNPFLFGIKRFLDCVPLSEFDSILLGFQLPEGDISVLYPYIDAAFKETHKAEYDCVRHLMDSSFFRKHFQRRGERANVGCRCFIESGDHSILFSDWFNWDFLKQQPYPNDYSGANTLSYVISWNLDSVSPKSICATITNPLGERRYDGVYLVSTLESLRNRLALFSKHNDILAKFENGIFNRGAQPEIEALKEDVKYRTVPDLVLADEQYVVLRFDWENTTEVRVKTADGEDKFLAKEKYDNWLKAYLTEKYKTFFDCFGNDSQIVKRIVDGFEKEGYLEVLEPGFKFKWLKGPFSLACWFYELCYSFGNGKDVPSKKLLRFFPDYVEKGDSIRRAIQRYKEKTPSEREPNWKGENYQTFLSYRGEDDPYVKILTLFRKIVHTDEL